MSQPPKYDVSNSFLKNMQENLIDMFLKHKVDREQSQWFREGFELANLAQRTQRA